MDSRNVPNIATVQAFFHLLEQMLKLCLWIVYQSIPQVDLKKVLVVLVMLRAHCCTRPIPITHT